MMDDLTPYFTPANWLLLALICGSIELLLPGIYFLWLALAALPTALLTYLFGFDVVWQLGLFTLFTICSLMAGYHVMKRMRLSQSDDAVALNQRGKRLVGETLVVIEPIIDGRGRVREGDGSWLALGPDAPVGAKVRVVGVAGSSLKVVPLQA